MRDEYKDEIDNAITDLAALGWSDSKDCINEYAHDTRRATIYRVFETALTEARAQGAADERERLAPHLHTAIAVITEMLEREGISDPETFPPLVEIRAAFIRSQKGEG